MDKRKKDSSIVKGLETTPIHKSNTGNEELDRLLGFIDTNIANGNIDNMIETGAESMAKAVDNYIPVFDGSLTQPSGFANDSRYSAPKNNYSFAPSMNTEIPVLANDNSQFRANMPDKDVERIGWLRSRIDNYDRTTGDASVDEAYANAGVERKADWQNEIDRIQNQNLSGDENAVKKWLDNDYKMTKSEVESAKNLISEYEKTARNLNVVDDVTEEEKAQAETMSALKDKVNKSESFLYGSMNAIPGVDALMQKGDEKYYGWSLDDMESELATRGNINLTKEEQDKVSSIDAKIEATKAQIGKTQNVTGDTGVDEATNALADERLAKRIEELQKQKYEIMLESGKEETLDTSYGARKQNAITQHPVSYYAGDVSTRMAETALGRSVLGGTSYGQGLESGVEGMLGEGKASQLVVSSLEDLPVDIATDTIPEYLSNKASGMSDEEANRKLLTNVLVNLGINFAVGSLQTIGDYKKVLDENADNLTKSEYDSANELIDSIAKQEDEIKQLEEVRDGAVDEIKRLNEQIPEMPDEIGSLTENNIPTYNDIKKGGVVNGTTVDGRANTGNIRPEELGRRGQETSSSVDGVRTYTTKDGRTFDLRDVVDEKTSKLMDENGYTNIGIKKSDDLDSFSKQLEDAKKANPSGRMVSSKSVGELKEEGARVFTNDEKTAGFAIEKNGNIVAVHKNPIDKRKNAVDDLLLTAVANGGDRLDCYGKGLVAKYERCGFRPVAMVEWNPKFKPDDWGDNPPETIFVMMRDDRPIEQVIEEYGSKTFKVSSAQELDSLPMYSLKEYGDDAYDEALKYRDSLIDEQLAKQKQGAFFDAKNPDDSTIPFVKNQDEVEIGRPVARGEELERGYSESINAGKVDLPDEILKDFEDNPMMYRQLRNKDTQAFADRIFEESQSLDEAYLKFDKMIGEINPSAVPLGYKLANEFAEAGRHDDALKVVERVTEMLTESGRFSQAAYITMLKNDPIAARMFAERELAKLNKEGLAKYGEKVWKDFELTAEEVAKLDGLTPGDVKGIKGVLDGVGKRIAKEYPSSLKEKLVSLRHTAMLFNLPTHLRNTESNAILSGISSVKDRVSGLGQGARYLYGKARGKDMIRTQSVLFPSKTSRSIAKEISADYKPLLDELGVGKYEELKDASGIFGDAVRNKQMFKDSKVTKAVNGAIDKLSGGHLSKESILEATKKITKSDGLELTDSALENLTRFNYFMMGTVEDNPFVKADFNRRLASFIQANGIKSIEDVPEYAKEMALLSALQETFKDSNKLSDAFLEFKKKFPGLGELLFPFPKTPANIAVRAAEYSPAGIPMAINKATKQSKKFVSEISDLEKKLAKLDEGSVQYKRVSEQLKNANKQLEINATNAIDDLAKSATGTMGIIAGYELAKRGIISGKFSDDKDVAAFQREHGYKEYAIHIGNRYIPYSWAQPTATMLIMGTAIKEAFDDITNEEKTGLEKAKSMADSVKTGALAAGGAWFDQSMLSTLKDVMGGGEYSSDNPFENLINAVADIPSSFIPTIEGQYARAKDPVMRQTVDQTSKTNTIINGIKAQIPKLGEDETNWWNSNIASTSLPISYSEMGNPRMRSDEGLDAYYTQMLSPSKPSKEKYTDVEKKLKEFAERTGNSDAIPYHVSSYYKVNYGDGTSYELNNKEVSEMQKILGRKQNAGLSYFVNSEAFNSLDDESKTDVIKKIKSLSLKLTESELFGKPIPEKSEYKDLEDLYNVGGMDAVVDELVENKYTLEEKNEIKSDGLPYNQYVLDAWSEGDSSTLDAWRKVQSRMQEFDGSDANLSAYKQYVSGGETGLNKYLNSKKKLLDVYGIDSVNAKLIEAAEKDDKRYLSKYNTVLSYAQSKGLDSINDTVIKQYDTYGSKGIDDYIKVADIALNQYGESVNQKMLEAYAEDGERGVKEYFEETGALDRYGLSNTQGNVDLYHNMGDKGLSYYADVLNNDDLKKPDSQPSALGNMIPYLEGRTDITDEEKGEMLYSLIQPGKKTQKYFDEQDFGGLWDFYSKKY